MKSEIKISKKFIFFIEVERVPLIKVSESEVQCAEFFKSDVTYVF